MPDSGQTFLQTETFFRRQGESSELPSTSQPTPEDFKAVYEELLGKGHEAVISVHISSDMSKTVASARSAGAEIGNPNIHVVDSRDVSLGLGRLVIEASHLIAEGKDAKSIVSELEAFASRIRIIRTCGTIRSA